MSRFALSSCVWFLPFFAAGIASAQTYTITTIAGNGTAGFTGDGAAATAAQFDTPYAVARDSAGNLYIADQANNRIRKIDTAGMITTVAGDGTEFYLGDGGAATKASLINPLGVLVSSTGEIYIADSRNHAIRKIKTDGNIVPVAGNGNPGFSGDKDTDDTTVDALATDSNINRPIGMAFDAAGNLLFTDSLNMRVRKVDTAGNISTIAGTGEAAYGGDEDLATKAKLNYPQGIAIDSGGNIYISDGENHLIRKITTDGIIHTVAGNRLTGYTGDGVKATTTSLFYPRGIAVSGSTLYIADTLNSRIRRVAEDGTITTIAGIGTFGDSGDGGPAEQAELLFPAGVTAGLNGTVYVVDTQNQKIKLLTPRPSAPASLPAIDTGGIITASAFGGFAQAAPGSWVEIYGSNFATATREWTAADFVNNSAPTSLGGVTVTIAGQPAPISYVSPKQINVQVPTGIGLGPQQVVVQTAAGSGNAILTVNAAQPGLLAPSTLRINNTAYAGAVFSDGSTLVMPAGTSLGFAAKPAKAGDVITLYGVGFGSVTPDVAAGQIPGRQTALVQPLKIYFGETEAQIVYAGLAPSLVGAYQFNIVVPNVAAGSAIPLRFTLGGQPGAQGNLFVAVTN